MQITVNRANDMLLNATHQDLKALYFDDRQTERENPEMLPYSRRETDGG